MPERALDTKGRIRLVEPPAALVNTKAAFSTSFETDDVGHVVAIDGVEHPLYMQVLGIEVFTDVLRTLEAGNSVKEQGAVTDLTVQAPVERDPFVVVDVLGERRTRIEEYEKTEDNYDTCVHCDKQLDSTALIIKQRVTKREAALRGDMDGGKLLLVGLHRQCVMAFTNVLEQAFVQTDILLSDNL